MPEAHVSANKEYEKKIRRAYERLLIDLQKARVVFRGANSDKVADAVEAYTKTILEATAEGQVLTIEAPTNEAIRMTEEEAKEKKA